MLWYHWAIIVLSILFTAAIIVFIFAWHAIGLKIKARLSSAKNNLFVTERRANNIDNYAIAKFRDGKINIGPRVYPIKKEHVKYSFQFKLPSIVVSEAAGTSIDAGETGAFSPEAMNNIIKRIKATALSKFATIINLLTYAIIALGAVVLIQCYILFRFYQSAQAAGINIAL
jgi:hypothetical protein